MIAGLVLTQAESLIGTALQFDKNPRTAEILPLLLALGVAQGWPRRGHIEIMAELLEIASHGGVSKTALVYRANLNFALVEKYIAHLESMGMIEHSNGGSRVSYSLTAKGWEALFSAKKALHDVMGENPEAVEPVQFP